MGAYSRHTKKENLNIFKDKIKKAGQCKSYIYAIYAKGTEIICVWFKVVSLLVFVILIFNLLNFRIFENEIVVKLSLSRKVNINS